MKSQVPRNPIHSVALELCERREKITVELIQVIQKICAQQLFFEVGCRGIYDYCQMFLKLNEYDCSTFKRISEKWDHFPELKLALEEGKITANKAGRILNVLEKENASFWIEEAGRVSQRTLEKMVADAKPELAVREKSKPIGNNRRVVIITVTEEEHAEILRAQDLHSQSKREAISLGQAVALCVKDSLKLRDPVQKAERAQAKAVRKVPTSLPTSVSNAAVSPGTCKVVKRAIPAANLHSVNARDKGRCQMCGTTRFCEIHHVRPYATGGTHDPENLVTLCSSHHRALHAGQRPWLSLPDSTAKFSV